MIHKTSLFLSSMINSFFEGGTKSFWNRTKYNYQKSLYLYHKLYKIDNDFFAIINSLKANECICYFHCNTYLDYSFHITLFDRDHLWKYFHWEDINVKPKYSKELLVNINFDSKLMVIIQKNELQKHIYDKNKIVETIDNFNFEVESNNPTIVIFKKFFRDTIFNSPYKKEL